MAELPKKAVVIGGGYIAVEFAGIWNGLGVNVDLIYRQPQPLRGFDMEMREIVSRNLTGRGVTVHPETNPTKVNLVFGSVWSVYRHVNQRWDIEGEVYSFCGFASKMWQVVSRTGGVDVHSQINPTKVCLGLAGCLRPKIATFGQALVKPEDGLQVQGDICPLWNVAIKIERSGLQVV